MQRPLSPQRHQLIDNFKVYNGMDAEPYRRTLEAIPQTIESVRARIGEIIIYPIKGMQGIYLEEALLTEKGLTTLDGCCRDRQAMLARIDPATGERVRFS
ncbi:MAG TPA: MOSC N-terminal beta barrel domain-containing protein, partial [Candidatus Peribacteraceae bacterium]|nr:MOSC N-terminal beta barrel domain-containing protein [Candidatus Peribacteraceae bacterium]